MDAQILILGLTLFCMEGSGGCDVPGKPAIEGRAYFVNATTANPDCSESRGQCKCKVCGAHGFVPCHRPILVFYKDHFNIDSNREYECGIDCLDANPDIGCIDISTNSLCIEETGGSGDFSLVPGRDLSEPEPQSEEDEDAFGWVGSIRVFDSLGGCEGDCFREASQLLPDGEYVTATLDFVNEGFLKAARVGKDVAGKYTHWKPKGSAIPYETALAEAAIWDLPGLDSFKIKTCVKDELLLESKESTSTPRAIIANLPPRSFCGRSGPGVRKLNHFALYYRLFDQPSSCTVPIAVKRGSYLEAFDVNEWLTNGAFDLPAQDKPGLATLLAGPETALCPPSKFP